MVLSDSRGPRVRAFDARLTEFATDSERAHDDDGTSLCELATMIFNSVSHWNQIMRHVAGRTRKTFDPEIAGILVIESVFDELLDVTSLGLLVAAFELAVSPE